MLITLKYHLLLILCLVFFQSSWAQKAKTTSHNLYKYDNKDYTVRIDSNSKKIQIGTSKKFIEYEFKTDSLLSDFHENGSLYDHKIAPVLSYKHKKSKTPKNQIPYIKVFSKKLKRKVKFLTKINEDVFFVVVKYQSKKDIFKKYFIAYILTEKGETLNIKMDKIFRVNSVIEVIENPFTPEFIYVELIKGRKGKYLLTATINKK